MIDQVTALSIAQRHAMSSLHSQRIGDMLVELMGKTHYNVTLVEIPLRNAGRSFSIEVDSISGKMMNSNVSSTEVGYYDPLLLREVTNLIDGETALKAALEAIRGYEHYDKAGRLTVQLRKKLYVVTFPLSSKGNQDSHRADYAYRISVDWQSAKVIEILTAS